MRFQDLKEGQQFTTPADPSLLMDVYVKLPPVKITETDEYGNCVLLAIWQSDYDNAQPTLFAWMSPYEEVIRVVGAFEVY